MPLVHSRNARNRTPGTENQRFRVLGLELRVYGLGKLLKVGTALHCTAHVSVCLTHLLLGLPANSEHLLLRVTRQAQHADATSQMLVLEQHTLTDYGV